MQIRLKVYTVQGLTMGSIPYTLSLQVLPHLLLASVGCMEIYTQLDNQSELL